jgi:hypothetical protein
VTKASNARALQDLSQTWRQSLAATALPPVASSDEPLTPADPHQEESAGQADPDDASMPEKPIADDSITPRVTRTRTKAK